MKMNDKIVYEWEGHTLDSDGYVECRCKGDGAWADCHGLMTTEFAHLAEHVKELEAGIKQFLFYELTDNNTKISGRLRDKINDLVELIGFTKEVAEKIITNEYGGIVRK